MADDPWKDADNAHQYAEFARRFPMYRVTSEHLVETAGLAPDATVLDPRARPGSGWMTCGTMTVLATAYRDVAVSDPRSLPATWVAFAATAAPLSGGG